MGRDDEDDGTAQQVYYGQLRLAKRHYPDRYAELLAGGPPPPVAADKCQGALAFYAYHPPRFEALGRLLVQMRGEGFLTDRVPPSVVDALIDHVRRAQYPGELVPVRKLCDQLQNITNDVAARMGSESPIVMSLRRVADELAAANLSDPPSNSAQDPPP